MAEKDPLFGLVDSFQTGPRPLSKIRVAQKDKICQTHSMKLETVFHALSGDADMENLSMDSTCAKVHGSANGGEKMADKAVGRTRGV